MKNFIYLFVIAVISVSCNSATNQGNMKAEANKARMQQFYDQVMNAHNPAMADSFCTADFLDHNPDPGRTGKGLADTKEGFAAFMAAYPDIKETTNFMIAQGDTVMAHITMTGTNSGSFAGMPPTNKQISIEGIDVVVLKDGKAAERWGFFDTMKMMEQLGLMPGPGAMPDSSMMKK
jgi:steroid delta-isomerase-like uncharacterized protein